jgi:hypothetical protein
MGMDEQLFKEGHWCASDRRLRISLKVSQNAVEKSLPFRELIPLIWSYTAVTMLQKANYSNIKYWSRICASFIK